MSEWLAHVRPRRAAVVVLVVVALPVLFGMAALAVDLGYLSMISVQLQNAADAGALAGVRELPDEFEARQVATQYAQMNMAQVATQYTQMNVASDITSVDVGNWDNETRTFTADMEPINAIKVIVQRREKLFFAPVLGFSESVIQGVSVAMAADADCLQRGIIAGRLLNIDRNARLVSYCVYARDGVDFDRDTEVLNDSKVGALDAATITYDVPTVGLPESIFESDTEPTLALNAAQLINDLENGDWPFQISNMVVADSLPAPGELLEGTLYIINGDIEVEKNVAIAVRNVIIAARGNIYVNQGGAIRNLGFDGTDDAAIGILATGNITLAQNASIENVNLVAGTNVQIDQGMGAFKASIQAGQDVHLDRNPQLIDDFKSAFGGEGSVQSSSSVGEIVQ